MGNKAQSDSVNDAFRNICLGLASITLLGIGAGGGLAGGSFIWYDCKQPAQIRPVQINSTNGYEIVSQSGKTNYFIYSGKGVSVEEINPNETKKNLETRVQIVTNQVPIEVLKYKIERDGK